MISETVKSKMADLGAKILNGIANNPRSKFEEMKNELSYSPSPVHKTILLDWPGTIVFGRGAIFKPAESSPVDPESGFQSLEVLYGLADDQNNIIRKNRVFHDQVSDSRYIAIGDAPGGNQICVDRKTGKVLFWYHEAPDEDNSLFEIAQSFEEFFKSLQPDEDSRGVESISGKIDESNSWLDL